MVRQGPNCDMEAHISNNSNKYKNREFAFGPSSMGGNTEPMVEVSHGYTTNLRGKSTGVEQAQKAIGSAPLGRIRMVDTR